MSTQKDKTVVIGLRIDQQLRDAIEKAAAKDYRTISNFMVLCIRRQLNALAKQ